MINPMRFWSLFLFFMLSLSHTSYSQDEHYKIFSTTEQVDTLLYSVQFKDHFNRIIHWSWTLDKYMVNEMKDKLGFDATNLDPLPAKTIKIKASNQKELERKKKALESQEIFIAKNYQLQQKKNINEGFFEKTTLPRKKFQEENLIDLDFQKAVLYYRSFTIVLKSVIEKTFTSLYKKNITSEELLQFLNSLIEDIPLNVTPDQIDNRFIGGFFSPPNIFNYSYADSDSKILFFASILANYPEFYKDVLIVFQKEHTLLAVPLNNPNTSYKYMNYKNKKYIFVDPIGPEKIEIGKMTYPNKDILAIQQIHFQNAPLIKEDVVSYQIELEQKGFFYDISMFDDANPISDTPPLVSTSNSSKYFTQLLNMPHINGHTYFGTFSPSIFLFYQKPGYLLNKRLDIPENEKNIKVEMLYNNGINLVKQNPNTNFVLIKYRERDNNATSFEIIPIKTDENGNFKALVEPGKYCIGTENKKEIDNTEKIYTYDGIEPVYITDFKETLQ